MGNCSGHWNKNDKSKFGHIDSCKSCGSHDSDCKCNSQPVRQHKTAPLSDCVLVNSVVGSKMVQKVAEITLPSIVFGGALDEITSISVVPNVAGITHTATVIRDKVVNIGLIPVTITITLVGGIVLDPIVTSIPFQEHTDFPGACPEDIVTESPFVVEGIFIQPGVPSIVEAVAGLIPLTGILIKVVLRTTITVTRRVIMDENGGICDVNDRRCETSTTPPTFILPAPGATGGLLGP